jgi:hypothetical protein
LDAPLLGFRGRGGLLQNDAGNLSKNIDMKRTYSIAMTSLLYVNSKNIALYLTFLLFLSGCSIPLGSTINDSRPDEAKMNAFAIISDLLQNRQKVCVAFIVGDIIEDGRPAPTAKSQLLNESEKGWLSRYVNFPNFSVVNRNHLRHNINELFLSNSGLISEDTRIKIGQLTGATHLVIIEATTWYKFFRRRGVDIYYKLIDIQDGRVLAIDKVTISEFKVLPLL